MFPSQRNHHQEFAMSLKLFALFILAFLSTACGTAQPEIQEVQDRLDSGDLWAPSEAEPVVLATKAKMLLYCNDRDGGCFNKDTLVLAGVGVNVVINWDPGESDLEFGTVTDPETGLPVFVVVMPYGSSGRGNAADVDAVNVDWVSEDGSDLASEGLSDGWYNLKEGADWVHTVYNCGKPSLNLTWGFDADGNPDELAALAALTYGEDYSYDCE